MSEPGWKERTTEPNTGEKNPNTANKANTLNARVPRIDGAREKSRRNGERPVDLARSCGCGGFGVSCCFPRALQIHGHGHMLCRDFRISEFMYGRTKDFLPCGRPSGGEITTMIRGAAQNRDSTNAIRDNGRQRDWGGGGSARTHCTTSADERNDTKCDTELIGGKTSDE